MSNIVRTWPALDVAPVSELFQAALADYAVVAIDERTAEHWCVFFENHDERDHAIRELRLAFPALTIEAVDVADENWAARSQASLRAIRVGNIIVAPPWDRPVDTGAAVPLTVIIQPSMGFGTGHHATTRLCLAALQRLDLRGRDVLDVGTGSGVLAIAASLLGAARVVGIDDDSDAVVSARESLSLNEPARVTLSVADLRSVSLSPADVVVANLTGGLLRAAASRLQQLVGPDGRLVVSGLMAHEEYDVLNAFTAKEVEHRAHEDEWLCLTLK